MGAKNEVIGHYDAVMDVQGGRKLYNKHVQDVD